MGRLHLKNVVLPAVVVACSVFSALTAPFVVADPNPVEVNLPPLYEGELQSIFHSENKGATIRYIGFAIVMSVGSGLITVEALRRLQATITQPGEQPQTPDAKLEALQAEFDDALAAIHAEEEEADRIFAEMEAEAVRLSLPSEESIDEETSAAPSLQYQGPICWIPTAIEDPIPG